VLYPTTGTTKKDVFDYYTSIAEVMVPHIAGAGHAQALAQRRRPSLVLRKAAGVVGARLAAAGKHHPPSGTTTYPIIDSVTALAWIGQQAALEVHVPQWRFLAEWTRSGERLKPGPATRLVFDLDPGEGVTMAQLAEVARAVRELIGDIGLTSSR